MCLAAPAQDCSSHGHHVCRFSHPEVKKSVRLRQEVLCVEHGGQSTGSTKCTHATAPTVAAGHLQRGAVDPCLRAAQLGIYGFSLQDGSLTHSWSGMSRHPLTACLHLPERRTLITASAEPSVTVRDFSIPTPAGLCSIALPYPAPSRCENMWCSYRQHRVQYGGPLGDHDSNTPNSPRSSSQRVRLAPASEAPHGVHVSPLHRPDFATGFQHAALVS
jgi:hypothetical protein